MGSSRSLFLSISLSLYKFTHIFSFIVYYIFIQFSSNFLLFSLVLVLQFGSDIIFSFMSQSDSGRTQTHTYTLHTHSKRPLSQKDFYLKENKAQKVCVPSIYQSVAPQSSSSSQAKTHRYYKLRANTTRHVKNV